MPDTINTFLILLIVLYLIFLIVIYRILNKEEIKKSVILIDVTNIKTNKELHILLKEKLKFPYFYNENWDDFWNAISSWVELPNKIEFVGWTDLEKRLPQDSKIMKEHLLDHNEEFPEWRCEYLFN